MNSNPPTLPSDILLLIFKELAHAESRSLRGFRIASRQLDYLITPLVYRHVKVTERIAECFKSKLVTTISDDSPVTCVTGESIRASIRAHTRSLAIDLSLQWTSVVSLLLHVNRLDQLLWSFSRSCPETRSPWPIATRFPQVLDALKEKWPEVQISLDNTHSNPVFSSDLTSILPLKIVSLKMDNSFRPFDSTSTKDLLLASRHLKVLHLRQRFPACRLIEEEIKQHERMPAVEELSLQGYFWHNTSSAISFWNWSKLTSLTLEKVFIVNFLGSVPPSDLAQLRYLVTDGHCESPSDHPVATNLMAALVRNVTRLETLSLNCCVAKLPVCKFQPLTFWFIAYLWLIRRSP